MRAESTSEEPIPTQLLPDSGESQGAADLSQAHAADAPLAATDAAREDVEAAAESLPVPTGYLDRDELNRALWIARLYYFAFFAALGSIVPFFNVYLLERGLSAPQIGVMASVPPIIALAANPFWGAAADRWAAHRRVLALCALGAGVASFAFIWVDQFLTILLFLCVLNFFRTPISAILDSTLMGIIAVNPEVSYGRQRVFGSAGWIVASLSVGFLVGSLHINSIFVLHGLLLGVMCTLLSLRLPVQRTAVRANYLAGLGSLIKLPDYRSVVLLMVLFGAGLACISNFVGINVLRLGGTAAMIGYTNAAAASLEIPVMFMGHIWTRRISRRTIIIVGMVGIGVTWSLLSAVTNPRIIPFFQAAFGVFFALAWPALVGFIHSMAPDGLRASAQTIAQAGQSGLGWALGSLASGFLWAWSPTLLFLSAGAMALLGAATFAAGTRRRRVVVAGMGAPPPRRPAG